MLGLQRKHNLEIPSVLLLVSSPQARAESVMASSSEKLQALFTACCETMAEPGADVPDIVSAGSLDDLAKSPS